tara:strand:- start:269 stop:613 length:345 start_codon:yes stop_codon:yes gene_type:complete
MRVVLAMLNKCPDLAVKLYHAYQKTTSTMFREQFLQIVVRSPLFKDDELEVALVGTVESGQKAIIAACKKHPQRSVFVGRMVEKGVMPQDMRYYATSEQLKHFWEVALKASNGG